MYDFYLVGFVLEKMVCSFKKTKLLFMVLIFRSEDLTRCHWRWKIMIFIRLTLCQFNVISCADEFHIGRLCIHALDKGNLVWFDPHTPTDWVYPKIVGCFSLGPSISGNGVYMCVWMCVCPSSLQRWLITLLGGATDWYSHICYES